MLPAGAVLRGRLRPVEAAGAREPSRRSRPIPGTPSCGSRSSAPTRQPGPMSAADPGATRRRGGGRRAARPGHRAGCGRSRTAARAGCPTSWRRRPGCRTAPRSRPLYYLTCPRAAAAISGLEAAGLMREMTERLADDGSCGPLPSGAPATTSPAGTPPRRRPGSSRCRPGTQSAGGMPDRVKCLHALVAHELAVPGANPFGREALDAIGPWWSRGPCVDVPEETRVTITRVAAIDCGTNSIRLLIADLNSKADDIERTVGATGTVRESSSPLTDVAREMRIVRLGEGVDRTGRLSRGGAGPDHGRAARVRRPHRRGAPEAVRMVATSATRDAANSQEFTDRVVEVLGVAPEVISGDDGGAAVVHRRDQGTGRHRRWPPRARARRPTWSPTSAAARPSSSSAARRPRARAGRSSAGR